MIEMVVPLMSNGFLQRTVYGISIASTKASFMAAAKGLIAPIVNKHHEARDSTRSVFLGELMAILVPDAGLWEVSGQPLGIVEGPFEYIEL
jgi:uncharacterized PurR-regulated membrane protein YhhQ (DUF165 family)